ncbi:hybrid sensor histidine kinase/response regulator, partial [Sesbania bispinosa]
IWLPDEEMGGSTKWTEKGTPQSEEENNNPTLQQILERVDQLQQQNQTLQQQNQTLQQQS